MKILNNIKLTSKLKFSLNKEIKTQPEIKEESKENISFIPSAPKLKKQIIRNHKNLKKIPSTNYISSCSINKNKSIKTIDYSTKEENDKRTMISNNNTLQERNITKIKSLKHIKKIMKLIMIIMKMIIII